MFIFELAKRIFKPEKKETEFEYNPLNLEKPTDEYEGEEKCNHEFMPIDSTGEVLACIKCGFIVKRYNNEEG